MNIRKLDWKEILEDRGDGSKECAGWEADTGFGVFYEIRIFADHFEVSLDYERISEWDDPERAKASGQFDFERRIKAAHSS